MADVRPKTPGFFSRKHRADTELEEFRSLMKAPGTFEDGFSWTAFAGALFVAMLMVPGSIYMTLIAGLSIGPAAQWVTVILFIEVARRANKHLRRAEIFTLFYLAGAIIVTASMAQGQFQGGLGAIWAQFFAQSDAARAAGIAEKLPTWIVPTDPAVLDQRSLLLPEWLPVIGLVVFTMVIGRIDNMILGYGLFRLTSDIEKLPFPMAPVGAQGIMALSEEQDSETSAREGTALGENTAQQASWRWRVFSIGSVLGIVFGAIYIGIPTVTGALLDKPITILPLPFKDFTSQTGQFLPAAAIAISFDLGMLLLGMVLPYWAAVGTFAGLVITLLLNPILHLPEIGILKSWNPGDNMQTTFYKNQMDFYFSFAIGVGMAIAIAGFVSVGKAWAAERKRSKLTGPRSRMAAFDIPAGRGDIRTAVIIATYLGVMAMYITVSTWLLYLADGAVYWPVVGVMLFYAIIYTPIVSYVTARLEGIAGEVLNIPFVREASFIFSGYHGVAIWFLPIPLHNYGAMTVFYRQCELTGTRFWSIWKSEILLTPIIVGGSLLFAHFIWGLGPIPSPQYLFAQEWWEVTAAQQSIIFSSTLGGFTEFEAAFNGNYILAGLGVGGVLFAAFAWLGAPTFFIYGIVRGLNQTLPFVVIPQFIGALIGRFYFRRQFGLVWRQYVPVVFAGFACGMGLIGTLGIGATFVSKSVFTLPF
ncbi:MAG: hypothetical protein SFV15_19275 [Polyangiaceae bacterium]|nr:hypothetical protein [Polyangiaceae bacterium]